ncbi:MAG: NAD(P)-dependent oxidoreductase [Oscillospiraceae bacterium]|nr:NAD(P)-dependent oxidoreductase [Oscillospiraceae bacterium]
MKVLVLGASGLAGSAVMKALQKAGHSVSGTYRTAPKGGGDPALLHFDLDEPRSIVQLHDGHPDRPLGLFHPGA